MKHFGSVLFLPQLKASGFGLCPDRGGFPERSRRLRCWESTRAYSLFGTLGVCEPPTWVLFLVRNCGFSFGVLL